MNRENKKHPRKISDDEHTLLDHHDILRRKSAIRKTVAKARGYRSVTNMEELERLDFSRQQRLVPGLLIPIHNVHGKVTNYQLRPDKPRFKAGKPIKYETVAGSRLVLDVPPGIRDHIKDPSVTLWVTEGARKADSGVSAGLCCIGLMGVWGWKGTNAQGGKAALSDWDSIALSGREVIIAFDSDAAQNRQVKNAEVRLSQFLEGKGARVRIARIPPCKDGKKQGLDDYLAEGFSADSLLENAESPVV